MRENKLRYLIFSCFSNSNCDSVLNYDLFNDDCCYNRNNNDVTFSNDLYIQTIETKIVFEN